VDNYCIIYGGIPQQVLGSNSSRRSNIITPGRERIFHEWWYYYAVEVLPSTCCGAFKNTIVV